MQMKEYIIYLADDPKFLLCAFAALSIGWMFLFFLIIVLFLKNRGTRKKIERFLGNNKEESLEQKLDEFNKMGIEVAEQEKNIKEMLESLEGKLKYTLQRVGVYRYNPFPDVGGDLSFSIALLDNTNSGFVITGIYTRNGSFTYLKPVRKGRGDENDKRYRLSKEETEAVCRAIASH